jgi:zinc transporter ZupT
VGTPNLTVIILSVAFATACATFLGGLAALRFSDKLRLILGFSAGTVVGLAFFDLLPEALRLRSDPDHPETILAIAAAGFFAYAILDRLLLARGDEALREVAVRRGWAGAGSLSVHSFVDGLALGIGFLASTDIGIAVAVAILAHDCSDGMNTVSIVLKNGGSRRAAFGWLIVDALAPIAGAGTSLILHPPEEQLALVLAAFAGLFLYIGASDLLPEGFQGKSKAPVALAMLLGAATLYAVVRITG